MENTKLTKKQRNNIIIKYVERDLGYMTKAELRDILNNICNADIKKSASHKELYLAVIKACGDKKTPYLNIYKKYKNKYFGINIRPLEQILNINAYKRRELEKYKTLKVMYEYKGDFGYISVYDLEGVLNLVGEDLDALLKAERKRNKLK